MARGPMDDMVVSNSMDRVMAMDYREIEVKPLTTALGAEIAGVDLAEPLDNAVADEVHRAFLDHQVIFFRDQHLTPEQHKTFGRRFGSLNVHPFVGAMPGHPEIIEVLKDVDDTHNFGGLWHTDLTFLESPPLGSILYALDAPESGGDTMWANLYMAYDALSDGMKELLDGMVAIHSAARVYGPPEESNAHRRGTSSMKMQQTEEATEVVEHPVIRTHPETGRKCLFVDRGYTRHFKDMTVEESRPLLDYLYKHATRPEFTCRWRWRTNDVGFWDNRCTYHYALNDYHGQRRLMHRVTVNGDRPV